MGGWLPEIEITCWAVTFVMLLRKASTLAGCTASLPAEMSSLTAHALGCVNLFPDSRRHPLIMAGLFQLLRETP
jgi:hypothetical protein